MIVYKTSRYVYTETPFTVKKLEIVVDKEESGLEIMSLYGGPEPIEAFGIEIESLLREKEDMEDMLEWLLVMENVSNKLIPQFPNNRVIFLIQGQKTC